MPRRASTPDTRAADGKRTVARVRRKYKVNLNKPRKFVPGEEDHVAQMVLVLKLASYTHTQIGKAVGVSRGQVKEILAKPENQAMLVELRAIIPDAAIELLQGYLIEAVQAIVDVMRTTEDDSLILKAAAEIMDRAGIPKASRQERLQENKQTTVFTDDGILEQLRDAPPEVQEEAAQMVEAFEKFLGQHVGNAEDSADETV